MNLQWAYATLAKALSRDDDRKWSPWVERGDTGDALGRRIINVEGAQRHRRKTAGSQT